MKEGPLVNRPFTPPGSSLHGAVAGFNAPLAMLSACHTRIVDQCATLQRLVPHLVRHGADADARTAAANVIRYFDTAAPLHHDDEEIDLFPALIESMAGSDAVCLHEMTAALAAEHRELEARWARIRGLLTRVVAGVAVELDGDAIKSWVDLYAGHIEREERELLPMAARLLSDDELDHISRAMRKRRGVDPRE
jgi:hemerythrin-like domain-containing protein